MTTWVTSRDDAAQLERLQQRLADADHNADHGTELAKLWLEIGLIHERQNDLSSARDAYAEASRHSLAAGSPNRVASRLQLGSAMRLLARSQSDLQAAELVLREAVDLVENTRGTDQDDDDLRLASDVLLLLLCQDGGRDNDAAKLMHRRGYTHRLSHHVLAYAYPPQRGPWAIDVPYVKAVDDALPQQMLQHMQRSFVMTSPFWHEHYYSQVTPYFSYVHDLSTLDPAHSQLDAVIAQLKHIACKLYPEVNEATKVEWWAHCRPHGSGHQLHFDSDNEGLSREGGKPRHPIVSSVLYLSEGLGGPTLVTDQRLGDPLASNGWFVFPKVNRFTIFDGSVLHGVVPGRDISASPDGRRITFMLAFWRDVQTRGNPEESPGSARPFPDARTTKYTWPQLVLGKGSSSPNVHIDEDNLQRVIPTPVEAVWDEVPTDQPIMPFKKRRMLPRYEECFQGF